MYKLILTFILFYSYSIHGQYGYYKDVVKFAQYHNGGSARVQALGGASISLGGDVSSVTINPAGLGFFNKKVFSISHKSESIINTLDYISEISELDKSFSNINNISLVLPLRSRQSSFRKGVFECISCPKFNFGASYNRLKDFTNERYYRGYNDNNSIIDYFLIDAQGVPLSLISNSQPISGIGILQEAYDHYLINPDTNLPGSYFSFIGGFPLQEERVNNSGGISKFSISSALNFNDKFFFGFGANFYSINYVQNRIFKESNYEILNENGNWEFEGILDYLILNDHLKISGNGSSISFGIIIKPTNQLNIGFNYESKTKYFLKEEIDSELETSYFDYYFQPEDTILGASISGTAFSLTQYNFDLPSKFSIGSSYFIKKHGFISADIDLINYTSSSMLSKDFSSFNDNQEIKNIYKTLAVNYRIGIEGRYNKFYIRAGYNFLADPNRISDNIDNSKKRKSIGFGYLSNGINLDITYLSTKEKSFLIPYPIFSNQPIADISSSKNVFLISLGIRINNR